MKRDIVKKLNENISINKPLSELIDIFGSVCDPSFVKYDDMYLFETGVYDFTGEDLFHSSLVLQYQITCDDEYIKYNF